VAVFPVWRFHRRSVTIHIFIPAGELSRDINGPWEWNDRRWRPFDHPPMRCLWLLKFRLRQICKALARRFFYLSRFLLPCTYTSSGFFLGFSALIPFRLASPDSEFRYIFPMNGCCNNPFFRLPATMAPPAGWTGSSWFIQYYDGELTRREWRRRLMDIPSFSLPSTL